MHVVDSQRESREEFLPAFDGDGSAIFQGLEEFFFIKTGLVNDGADGTDGFQAAAVSAVAFFAAGLHLDVLEGTCPAVRAAHDLPGVDHGRTEVLGDIHIQKAFKLRRMPQLRIGAGIRVVQETAGIVEQSAEGGDLQACTAEDLSVDDLGAVRTYQPRDSQSYSEDPFFF